MTTFNPAIAVIQDNSWAIMPLANLIALDDGIDPAASDGLGYGATWVEGGGASPVAYLVNLDHRDTPMHFPSRAVADLAYAAFCFFHGLDGTVDAQQNLTTVLGYAQGLPVSSLLVNWLSAFVDHYDEWEA